MRAEPQLAPCQEFDCRADWERYVRCERCKAEDRRYRSGLLKTGLALLFGAAALIYLFVRLNHHLL